MCAGGVHLTEPAAGTLESAFGATLASSCPAALPLMLAAPPAVGPESSKPEQLVVVDVAMHDRLLGGIAAVIVA